MDIGTKNGAKLLSFGNVLLLPLEDAGNQMLWLFREHLVICLARMSYEAHKNYADRAYLIFRLAFESYLYKIFSESLVKAISKNRPEVVCCFAVIEPWSFGMSLIFGHKPDLWEEPDSFAGARSFSWSLIFGHKLAWSFGRSLILWQEPDPLA